MMGFTLSCYLGLQEGSIPDAWHVNAPRCSGNIWAEDNWKGQSGRFGGTSGGLREKLLV